VQSPNATDLRFGFLHFHVLQGVISM